MTQPYFGVIMPVIVVAARFASLELAGEAYHQIAAAIEKRTDRLDIGVSRGLVPGCDNAIMVCVTLLDTPPPDVQEVIGRALSTGEPWQPPQDVLQAIMLRRMRQSLAGTPVPGQQDMRLFKQRHQYPVHIDREGRDVITPPEVN